MYVCMCVRVHVRVWEIICVCAYVRACVYVYVCVCITPPLDLQRHLGREVLWNHNRNVHHIGSDPA